MLEMASSVVVAQSSDGSISRERIVTPSYRRFSKPASSITAMVFVRSMPSRNWSIQTGEPSSHWASQSKSSASQPQDSKCPRRRLSPNPVADACCRFSVSRNASFASRFAAPVIPSTDSVRLMRAQSVNIT